MLCIYAKERRQRRLYLEEAAEVKIRKWEPVRAEGGSGEESWKRLWPRLHSSWMRDLSFSFSPAGRPRLKRAILQESS